MDAARLAEVQLVRAVEETDPAVIPAAARAEALDAAGNLVDPGAWVGRRASHLIENCLQGYRPILRMAGALEPSALAVLALPFLVGVATNYLGPSQRIHVLYNPIVALVFWNLGVFALAAIQWARRSGKRPGSPPAAIPDATPDRLPSSDRRAAEPRPRKAGLLTRWLVRGVLPGLLLRLTRDTASTHERVRGFSKVGRRFWRLWTTDARALVAARLRRILHLGAIGLTLGAVAGMFVRGLFFDYRVVWRSTFLHDPEAIARVLRALLEPAALVSPWAAPTEADVTGMMQPSGVGAADWIWLYAITAMLFVVLPRTLLTLRAVWQLRRASTDLEPDLRDPYYAGIQETARVARVDSIRGRITSVVDVEANRFAEALATIAGERLYDRRIAPRLEEFRAGGGKIEELEATLRGECDGFAPEFETDIRSAQEDFERSLSAAVERAIGVQAEISAEPAGALGEKFDVMSGGPASNVSDGVGRRMADTVGASVSAALAGAFGTVSGGFGHVLGAKVLVVLLGTSGPVGFLIGALLAGGVGISAWWAGRDRMASSIQRMWIPAWVAKFALSSGRVAAEREKFTQSIQALVAEQLEPLAPAIAEQIWTRVEPMLGAPAEVQARVEV